IVYLSGLCILVLLILFFGEIGRLRYALFDRVIGASMVSHNESSVPRMGAGAQKVSSSPRHFREDAEEVHFWRSRRRLSGMTGKAVIMLAWVAPQAGCPNRRVIS